MRSNIHPSSIIDTFKQKLNQRIEQCRKSIATKPKIIDYNYYVLKVNNNLPEIEKTLQELESVLSHLKSFLDDPISSSYLTRLYSSENLKKLELEEAVRRLIEKQLKDEDNLKQSIENAYFAYVDLLHYILSDEFLSDHKKDNLPDPSSQPNEFVITIADRSGFILKNLSLLTLLVKSTYEFIKAPQDLSKLQKLVKITTYANDQINYNKCKPWAACVGTTLWVISIGLFIVGAALALTGNPVGGLLMLAGFLIMLPAFGVVLASGTLQRQPPKTISHKGFSSALDKAADVISVAKSTIRSTSHTLFTSPKNLEPTLTDKTTAHNQKKKKPS